MRKHISAIIASALAAVGDSHGDRTALTMREHPPSVGAATSGAAGEQEKKQKYTCPMHPEVITDHPGNCPKCGMKLVPVKEKKRPTSNVQRSNAESSAASQHRHHPCARNAFVAYVAPVTMQRTTSADGNVDALHHRSR